MSMLSRNRSRGPLPGYAPRTDDLYEFETDRLLTREIAIVNGRFELPAEAADATSALMKVRVKSSAMGKLRAPRISFLRDGRSVLTQQLDPGSDGLRYFDVSGALSARASGKTIEVRCERASIDRRAEVLLFRNRPIDKERVLVIAPHPDDAELAAFGLYKTTDSAVVTITAGDAGGNNYSRVYADKRAYELKSRVRVWDSLSVPLLAGLAPERVANLGYFDNTLPAMSKDPRKRFAGEATGYASVEQQRRALSSFLLRENPEPTWESLILDLRYVLRQFQPSVIVTPHPVIDAHDDHRYTSFAVLEAVAAESIADGRLLLYANHQVYCSDWPFGGPADAVALPPWPATCPLLRSFYSHPLSLDDQVDKLFALEAMHDLRRSPPPLERLNKVPLIAAMWETIGTFRHWRADTVSSYFRRAVRPREIFFEYSTADASMLLASRS